MTSRDDSAAAVEVLGTCRRHLRSTLRTPIWAIINLTPGGYETFNAPGVTVMTVIYGAGFATLGQIMDL